MPNVIGKIPDFTEGESLEEVKSGVYEETTSEETETPSESSSEEKPATSDETQEEQIPPEAPKENLEIAQGDEVINQLNALQKERTRLLREISELKGQKREIKKEELFTVQKNIQQLEDVNPQDAEVIEKVLRAKGYLTKEESNQMFYDAVKQEELNKFLEKYPEYRPENDPTNVNWDSLQREIALYKMPQNPHQIGDLLERAHKMVRPLHGAAQQKTTVVRRQMEVASVGGGGTQQSSSTKTLNSRYRDELLRGGWSEEDIKNIESTL